jgi:hypothetical protein
MGVIAPLPAFSEASQPGGLHRRRKDLDNWRLQRSSSERASIPPQLRDSNTYANADANSNGDSYCYSHIHAYSDCYGYSHPDSYPYSYGNSECYTNGYAYLHTSRHARAVDGGRDISLHSVWSGCCE